MKDLYESNFQPCFNDAAFTELARMILTGTYLMKLVTIGKFVSAILERTDVFSYERLNKSDGLLVRFFFQSGVV